MARSRGHRLRVPTFMAAGLGLMVLAAACGGSGFQYVQNDDEGVFIQVPETWAVFEQQVIDIPPIFAGDIGFEPEFIADVVPWQVIIDAGPNPTASHYRESLYDFPVGIAEVQPLPADFRDLLNTSELRALATDQAFDPVLAERELDSNVKVLRDEDVIEDNVRGNRVIFTQESIDGVQVVDHLVLVDEATSRYYRLTIGCEENCYRANADTIDDMVESFTVED